MTDEVKLDAEAVVPRYADGRPNYSSFQHPDYKKARNHRKRYRQRIRRTQ